METEDKAKVIASVWGAKCVQFLAALAILPGLSARVISRDGRASNP